MAVAQRRTVLLVEDEWLIRMDLADVLIEAGFAVIEAGSAEEALGFVHLGDDVSLLITDIRLAGVMTGWELAQSVRSVHPDLPVFYVSGNNKREDLSVRDGVFIEKPACPKKIAIAAKALWE